MTISENQLQDYTTALLLALEAKSHDTGAHASRVAIYALEIGRYMQLSPDQLDALKFGSLLHDLGKLKTPDAVLNKPGRLNPDEIIIMRQHPTVGADLLRALCVPASIWSIVREHHENFDGSGYPVGLRGLDIQIEARILAVADTYDAITCNRVYRKGAPAAIARHEIEAWSGTQFDPVVVDAFLQCQSFKNLAAA